MEDYDLLQCIDKGLERFGTSVKQTIYWKISILHGSLQNAIIANPSIFINVLRELFHDSSVGVEESLLKEISEVFGSCDGNTLEDAIRSAKDQITPTSNGPGIIATRAGVTPSY